MNSIQMAIIVFIVLIILFTLGYYWYDDARFKKRVENNFNQSTKDALIDEPKRATVFDSVDPNQEDRFQILQKDIANKDIFADAVPDDSVEAFFVKLDQVTFPFTEGVSERFDLVIDIVFEEPKKLKILPEIGQFTHKYFVFYVLSKNNLWEVCEKGKKYQALALKLVVQLVDGEGVISQAQIHNIYNELRTFVINNHAHIRCSEYEIAVKHIQEQMKLLNNVELILDLYLLTLDKLDFATISKFLKANDFIEDNGIFHYMMNNNLLFTIADEAHNPLKNSDEYNTLSIVAKLHLNSDPLFVVDKIFDLGEKFMETFESRILTSNKQVITQKEYTQLYNYVKNYTDSMHKKNIELGGTLMTRLFNK